MLWCVVNRAELAVRLHCFLAEEQGELEEQQGQGQHQHQHQEPPFRFRQRRSLLAGQDRGPGAPLPHRHMRLDALFQRPQDSQLPSRGVGDGGGGDNMRRRVLDSDDDYDEEAEDDFGFYGWGGHRGAEHAPRIGPRRLVIASSEGDQRESRATGHSGSGASTGASSVPGGGTSALGSAQRNTVVYRSHSQPQPLQSSGGSPVATLLTEAAGSMTTGAGAGSGSPSNSSFRFSTMTHSPASLSSSAHVSSQRLVSSGHSSLGGSRTDSMDDIDEVVDSAAARAAFLASSAAAGTVAGRQLTLPANTTFMVRSSGNGSASTVVPVVSPPPQP